MQNLQGLKGIAVVLAAFGIMLFGAGAVLTMSFLTLLSVLALVAAGILAVLDFLKKNI